MPAEGDEKGVQDKIGEIKKRFGIDVKMTALAVGPSDREVEPELQGADRHLRRGHGARVHRRAMVGGGYFMPLNTLRRDEGSGGIRLRSDFPKGELNYVGYFDPANGTFGGKTLYLIPGLHGGSVILFYRKDLFKAAGVAVPKTWGQYLAAAKKLNGNGVSGNSMIAKSGDVSMFLVDWYTRFANSGGAADERLARRRRTSHRG